jgi:Arc/MetJ-type ribon-helix-helix transcriptional regulator
MNAKRRLSASVDTDLLQAAEAAVSGGEASSVSAWVNEAFRLKLTHDARLAALSSFIREYEADNGEITAEEIRLAGRRASASAIPVRGPKAGPPGSSP